MTQTDLFTGAGEGRGGTIEEVELHQTTRQRYLNYALSVITSRALPDVRDGLKPVQRRILYGMYKDLKLRHDSRYLKSARVVGDVMGKYHPHGDQSIYEAMVRMAQPFSLRYPLVDGQGNFGSIDGDGAAAMRYTEARLRALSEELLAEITSGTVDFRPTYDGQNSEPLVLPARIPNLLANGTTGIAVGMATNIPPHNLRELIDACILLIRDPETPTHLLCNAVQGPDFPTKGEILSTKDEIVNVYETGQGAIKLRGEYTTEMINKKRCIIITSIPYGQNKSVLIEKIAQLILARKVPQIVDIRDESTDDVRIVMELKKGEEAEVAMAYLYKNTPLQSHFNVNFTCLVPTANPNVCTPKRIGLREMLQYFLDFRLEVITRRLRHQLSELQTAIHRLEGFETVFDALDEIIAIIRKSEGKADAARKLMARFDLDEEQTDAILELKLYRLAKLEILLIRQELDEKRRLKSDVELKLSDINLRWQMVIEDLREIRDAFGDERLTRVVGPREDASFNPEQYIVKESTVVIITKMGRIKRQKGFTQINAIRVPEGDEVAYVLKTDTRQTIAFYTQKGSVYVLRTDDIPATAGHGEPLQKSFTFADGERVIGISCSDPKIFPAGVSQDDAPPPPYGVAVSVRGKIWAFPLNAQCEVSTKAGRKLMTLAEDDELLALKVSMGEAPVALASAQGHVLCFNFEDLPIKSSATKGVTAIKLDEKDRVIDFSVQPEGLKLHTTRGREVVVSEKTYAVTSRGGRGIEVIRVGGLVAEPTEAQVFMPQDDNEQEEEE